MSFVVMTVLRILGFTVVYLCLVDGAPRGTLHSTVEVDHFPHELTGGVSSPVVSGAATLPVDPQKFQELVLIDFNERIKRTDVVGTLISSIKRYANLTNTQTSGRTIGGIFNQFQTFLNSIVDRIINWGLLQGYYAMPERMDSIIAYMEALNQAENTTSSTTKRSSGEEDDQDFLRLMASYQPNFERIPVAPVPGVFDPANVKSCPKNTWHYKTCLKKIATTYFSYLKKDIFKSLERLTGYFGLKNIG